MPTIEIARITEAAAIAAAHWRGRGDERQADEAANMAMRDALDEIAANDGLAVIREGEGDKARMLQIADKSGAPDAPHIELMIDALEGTTLCAKAMPNSISCAALAHGGSLLHAPEVYMDKIAIGGGYPDGTIDLDLGPKENIGRLAEAKGVPAGQITACILDRPRHGDLIRSVREAGAAVRLITDGDVAGIIHTGDPEETGIDIYLGIGGAPEGVLAAAALRCIGGQMQARLVMTNGDQRACVERAGIRDPGRKFALDDLAAGDVLFAATGVTDGSLLAGVRFDKEFIITETVVMRSETGNVRWIKTRRRAGSTS
ncbi:class II fructose-bisphosphatase [soil metagenome]